MLFLLGGDGSHPIIPAMKNDEIPARSPKVWEYCSKSASWRSTRPRTRLSSRDPVKSKKKSNGSMIDISNIIELVQGCYPLVMADIASEHGHRNSWFTHQKWWCSTAMLVYQRVNEVANLQLGAITIKHRCSTCASDQESSRGSTTTAIFWGYVAWSENGISPKIVILTENIMTIPWNWGTPFSDKKNDMCHPHFCWWNPREAQ